MIGPEAGPSCQQFVASPALVGAGRAGQRWSVLVGAGRAQVSAGRRENKSLRVRNKPHPGDVFVKQASHSCPCEKPTGSQVFRFKMQHPHRFTT